MRTLKVTNERGRVFTWILTTNGEPFARGNALLNQSPEPILEVFDATYENVGSFGPYGQFIASYYASSIAEHDPNYGLSLQGDEPVWFIDAVAMRSVISFAKQGGLS